MPLSIFLHPGGFLKVLMRAYKFADADNSGLITKGEFVTLLRALTFFHNLWKVCMWCAAGALFRALCYASILV